MIIDNKFSKQRLDRYIRRKYGQVPQSLIEKAVRNKDILVNGRKAKTSDRVSNDDVIFIHPNIGKLFDNISNTNKYTKKIAISKKYVDAFKNIIIYEDESLLVVNKPSGMAVQLGSKINVALDIIARTYNPELRLVHRIDKDTSGLTIFAKNPEVAHYMLEQFKTKSLKKTYVALLSKKVNFKNITIRERLLKDKDKVIIDPVNGKDAITQFSFIKNISGMSLVYAKPLTGRTHQIRVHLAAINAPILGDKKYGGKQNKHLYLHAYTVTLKQYTTGKTISITAPLPEYFRVQTLTND